MGVGVEEGRSPVWWAAFFRVVFVRRRPTLPPRLQGSTIGAEGLSFRVRNGTGRFPFAMAAGTLLRYAVGGSLSVSREPHSGRSVCFKFCVLVKSSAY